MLRPPLTLKNIEDMEAHVPELCWLIQGILPKKAIGFLAAPPKNLKTWLGLDALVCVGSGGLFLGEFQAVKGPVLYFPAEGQESRIRARIEGLCKARGIAATDLEMKIIATPRLLLDRQEDQEALTESVRLYKPVLMMLDPLRNLFTGSENESSQVSAVTSYLTWLNREFGVAIIVMHHTGKASSKPNGKSMRGSTALHAWGDTNFYLAKTKKNDGSVLRIEFRDEPEPGRILFSLEDNGEEGIAPQLIGTGVEQCVPDELPKQAPAERIRAALQQHRTLTGPQMISLVKMNKQAFCHARNELVSAGIIQKIGKLYQLVENKLTEQRN